MKGISDRMLLRWNCRSYLGETRARVFVGNVSPETRLKFLTFILSSVKNGGPCGGSVSCDVDRARASIHRHRSKLRGGDLANGGGKVTTGGRAAYRRRRRRARGVCAEPTVTLSYLTHNHTLARDANPSLE